MNYGFIYETTNLSNNMKYIGKHKRHQNPKDPDDSDYLGSGKLLNRAAEKAMRELGDNWRSRFSRRILCECDSEEELQEKERYYINLYNAVDSSDYYNICEDANPPIFRGDEHPFRKNPELAKKLSETLKGRTFSEEHKRHISESKQGVWSGDKNPKALNPPLGDSNPFYGKSHTLETREKLSEYAKKRVGKNSPRYGAVLSEETRSSISKTLTGYKHTEEAKENMKKARANQKVKRVCKSCGTEFIARSAAARYCSSCKERR